MNGDDEPRLEWRDVPATFLTPPTAITPAPRYSEEQLEQMRQMSLWLEEEWNAWRTVDPDADRDFIPPPFR